MILTSFPFVLGLLHCFEIDHVLGVATLVPEKPKTKTLLWQGMTWGIGHAIPILSIWAIYIGAQYFILDSIPISMEVPVGLLLIIAGGYRLYHAMRAKKTSATTRSAVFGIGLAHGLAGSVGIVLAHTLTALTISEQLQYLFTFSLGSIIGMVLITVLLFSIINFLRYVQFFRWLIPIASIGYGCYMLYAFG